MAERAAIVTGASSGIGLAIADMLGEEGYDVVEVPLPALLTVTKEINEPRLPSLKGKMRAKKAEIRVMTAAEIGADPARIGLDGSPTWVEKVFTPPQRGAGVILQGEPDHLVARLVEEIEKLKIG